MHYPGYQSNNKQPAGPLILGLVRPSLKNCQLGVTSPSSSAMRALVLASLALYAPHFQSCSKAYGFYLYLTGDYGMNWHKTSLSFSTFGEQNFQLVFLAQHEASHGLGAVYVDDVELIQGSCNRPSKFVIFLISRADFSEYNTLFEVGNFKITWMEYKKILLPAILCCWNTIYDLY